MKQIDKQTENSMLNFLEKQLSELGIELENEKAKNKNISLEKIQLKNNIETLTKVKYFYSVNSKNQTIFKKKKWEK